MKQKILRSKQFKGHTTAIGAARLLKRQIKGSEKILDAGAGDGFFANHIKNIYGKEILAVDIEPENRRVKKADITNLPYKDGHFDLITCMDVIEHLDDKTLAKTIAELGRVLREGGTLFISTLVDEDFSKNACLCPKCETHFHRIGHKQKFSQTELEKKFSKLFHIDNIINTNFSLLSRYPAAERLLRNNKVIKKNKELNGLLNKDILMFLKKKQKNYKTCPGCGNSEGLSLERKLNNIRLMKCPKCNFVYADLSKRQIEKANMSFDDKYTARYENYQTEFDRAWFSTIVSRVEKKVGRRGSVLDIGCGNGLLLSEFKKSGWNISGLDFSPWAKKFAEEIGFKLYSNTIQEEKISKNSFDAVVCTSTLEHIERPVEFMESILNILKPGGVAYFSGMPNYGSLLIKLGFPIFGSNMPPMHVSYFTTRSLRNIIKKTSVSKCSVNSYGLPGFYQIYKKVPKKRKKDKLLSSERKIPNRFLVTTYYYLGRFFGLGDKLELIVEKK